MAVDVIIDPGSGQIYWNDAAGSGTQTIAISGNATNAINIVGYSNFFSAGGGGLGTQILATFTDSPTSTFTPGTNAYDLGSTSLRWNFYGTAGNFNGAISTSSTTGSGSTTTGALVVTGGVGIGDSLNVFGTISVSDNIKVLSQKEVRFFNSVNTFYTGLRAGSSSANVTFTLPIADGTANQVLYTNGSAGLAWTTVASVSAITTLNGLTAATQTFAVGTSGTDFNISSVTSTHTFNIPYAASGATGLVTTQAQTLAGSKTFSSQTIISDTTASTTTATGSLLVFGGLGVSGQINTASLQTTGNAVINGNLTFKGNGTFGDAITDTITSLARYVSDLLPSADNTYDLGNNALGWRNFKVSGVGTIATLQVTSITSGLWSGTAITLAYGGTNNNISGIGNSYRVAIYNDSGTAITNISSAGTANSVLFQSSQSVSPIWAGQSQLIVGGASTAANIQGGALGNVHYQTGANATGFVTNAAGSGASILSQTGNAVPLFLGQSQLSVGTATSSALVNIDASNGTRYLLGTVLNTASGSTQISTGSGITIGNNLLTSGGIAVTNSTASSSTSSGALTVVGGVGIGGSLWTATTNFSSISGVGFSNSVITSGVWSGTAISAVNGGTGQNTYTIGDILYASSATALAKLSAGTAGSVLTSNGAGIAPSYKAAGSGSPAGSSSFLQYNNAGSFGATSHLAYGGNGNNDFVISSPFSGAIQGQVNIGMGITAFDAVTLGKFAGSASGTIIAVNYATGFAGNFADFQLAGSSKFTIGADGKITVVGVYSLPTTAGTAGSVLTSNGNGNQFYWSAASSGGGAGTVASGTVNQVAIYGATGASVSGAANFTYNTTSVIITNTTASNNNSSGALLVHGGIGASGQISGAGASFTSTVFLNGIRIGQGGNNITFTDSAGTTIGDFNTSNGWLRSAQTTQSTTIGTGALVSSGGLGVAKVASIGETIYNYSTVASTGWSTGGLISSGGLGVSKASYFNGDLFVTSVTNSTSLTTGAVVISGGVGIGKTMFVGDNINIFKSGSVGALRLWNSANTFYTGLQAGAPAANTTYTLPIAFPGTAGSVLVSDLSGVMSWALAATGTVTTLTAGAGISFGGSTITTTGTIRRKTHYNLTFMSGYTPTASGVDTVVLRVPDSAADSGANIYNCREVVLRVETPSAGTSTINVQKYAGGGVTAFSTTSTGSTTNILSAALSITGATTYEASSSTFAAGHGTVAGGDKLRINFTALNATHVAFNISLLLEEQ
jgi:hypothetical protein